MGKGIPNYAGLITVLRYSGLIIEFPLYSSCSPHHAAMRTATSQTLRACISGRCGAPGPRRSPPWRFALDLPPRALRPTAGKDPASPPSATGTDHHKAAPLALFPSTLASPNDQLVPHRFRDGATSIGTSGAMHITARPQHLADGLRQPAIVEKRADYSYQA